jgi:hypothetical protein
MNTGGNQCHDVMRSPGASISVELSGAGVEKGCLTFPIGHDSSLANDGIVTKPTSRKVAPLQQFSVGSGDICHLTSPGLYKQRRTTLPARGVKEN